MVLDFETYCLNETSLKKIKRVLHGSLGHTSRAEMRRLLRKHVVHFKFKKKDGSLRRAVGTLIPSYLPALRGGAPKPEHQMVYYDLEKEHWRSFRSYSFIKILDIEGADKEEKRKKKEEEEIRKRKLHREKEKEHDEHEHDEDVEDVDDKKEKDDDKDIRKKEFKPGEKIPEKELMRRSTDFRKGSRKNKFTHKSNDAKKKGELDEDDKD